MKSHRALSSQTWSACKDGYPSASLGSCSCAAPLSQGRIFPNKKIRIFLVTTFVPWLWSFLCTILRRIWFWLFYNSPLASGRLRLDPPEPSPGWKNPAPSAAPHTPHAPAPDHPRGPLQDLHQFVKVCLALLPGGTHATIAPDARVDSDYLKLAWSGHTGCNYGFRCSTRREGQEGEQKGWCQLNTLA